MSHERCDCPVTPHERITANTSWLRGLASGLGLGLGVAGALIVTARHDDPWSWVGVGVFLAGGILDAWQRWLWPWPHRWERR